MTDSEQKLTLDRWARYQIKVPGALNERWSNDRFELLEENLQIAQRIMNNGYSRSH